MPARLLAPECQLTLVVRLKPASLPGGVVAVCEGKRIEVGRPAGTQIVVGCCKIVGEQAKAQSSTAI